MLSLRLYDSPDPSTRKFIADLTKEASETWRRSIRSNGGYWQGDFVMSGNIQDLTRIFYEYLGYHFEERSGGVKTWEGMLYEMELTHGGIVRRRSLEKLANSVTVQYRDLDNARQTSAAATSAASIERYGQREEIVYIDGFDSTAAEAYRDTYLKEFAWPTSLTIGINLGDTSESSLRITVCGYVFTGNWQFAPAGSGATANLSDYMISLIGSDIEFLQIGSIATNTIQVVQSVTTPRRVWDVIAELVGVGDANGNPYRIYVDNERYLVYEMISTDPRYYIRAGQIHAGPGESISRIDSWSIRPAVFRDMDYPVRGAEYGAWLSDRRDFYVSEVEVGPAGVILKTEDFEESEIMAAQQTYLAQMEKQIVTGENGPAKDAQWWKDHPGLMREKSKTPPALRGNNSGGMGNA